MQTIREQIIERIDDHLFDCEKCIPRITILHEFVFIAARENPNGEFTMRRINILRKFIGRNHK